MTHIAALLLAKALDPIAIIGGGLAGIFTRQKHEWAIVALLVAAVGEMILIGTQYTRGVRVESVAAAFAVSFAYSWAASAGVALYRRFRDRQPAP